MSLQNEKKNEEMWTRFHKIKYSNFKNISQSYEDLPFLVFWCFLLLIYNYYTDEWQLFKQKYYEI